MSKRLTACAVALRYSLASLAAVTAPLSALAFWCGLRQLRRWTADH